MQCKTTLLSYSANQENWQRSCDTWRKVTKMQLM